MRTRTEADAVHDELLTSARSRRRACEGRQSRDGRPAQARRLFQEDVRHSTRAAPERPSVPCRQSAALSTAPTCRRPSTGPCGSACSRRSPGARRRATTGPWEQFASLLDRGSRRRRPRRDAVRHGRLDHDRHAAQHVATGLVEEDPSIDPKVAECLHIAAVVRAGRRVRHHPQRLRLPAAHLQRTRRHPGRDDDPRVLVAARSCRCTSATTPRRTTWRSATPTATRGCTTPPRSTTASTSTPSPSHPDAGRAPAVLRADPPGQGHGAGDRGRPAAGRRLVIAGIVQDQTYFDDEVAPHLDGDAVRYLGPGRADRARPPSSAARTRCCTSSTSTSRSGSSSRRWPAARPVIASPRGSMPEISGRRHRLPLHRTTPQAVAPSPGSPRSTAPSAVRTLKPGSAPTAWSTTTSRCSSA